MIKKTKAKFFENKKVLLVGLGILGGGRAMAEFILKEGGELSVADLRDEELLADEINYLNIFLEKLKEKIPPLTPPNLGGEKLQRQIIFYFGEHKQEMFDVVDVVVFNPAVPYFSKWVQYCVENKKELYSDFTLFQKFLQFKNNKSRQIWITGTRGKTTTTTWVKDLLGDEAVIGGNVLGSGLQKIVYKNPKYFVLETSNYQLEYPINFEVNLPDVAILTNIFIDHINRHKTWEEYKRVKCNVFNYQKEDKVLFLNKDEKSTQFVNCKSKINFINNIDVSKYTKLPFTENQKISLQFAISVAKYFNISDTIIKQRIKNLTYPKMRQEIILNNKNWTIINDSTATSPDALIASLNNFKNNKNVYFISGGTDALLDFTELVKNIKKQNLIKESRIKFLKGTATDKILNLLNIKNLDNLVYDNLEKCILDFKALWKNSVGKSKNKNYLILSPGAKSFGLFNNEYDRGEKFNKLIKKLF